MLQICFAGRTGRIKYRDVMLPMVVLRRLDCVLEPTKEKVLAKLAGLKGGSVKNVEPILNHVAKHQFHNTSRLDFNKLKGDPDNIAANLTSYIKGFFLRPVRLSNISALKNRSPSWMVPIGCIWW